jgi:aspartyl-tRNA(Asn)/glutamyl-tRNA(Gln) amidotransferase subunit A
MSDTKTLALSLVRVRDAIATGELSSEAVTLACVEQAQRFDTEYALFITLTPEAALAEARAADSARASGKLLGPLHGVPITLKDNLDTAGLRTTGGAKVFRDRVPTQDATVVTKLKAAGAISLGKTNMHEMALGGTSTNPHYGAVRNPWDASRIPGGSSGGAAAAQSLQIGYAGVGTDSGGSVRMPASLCGLVGLKQTHGLVSLAGCMPTGTWSTDHIGPITRYVADAALMLSVMQGFDARDPDSSRQEAAPCGPLESLQGVTVGLPEHFFWEGLDPQVERICRGSLRLMEEFGARVVPVRLDTIDVLSIARPALMAEAFIYHEPYLRDHSEDYGEDIRYRLLASQYVQATDYIRATRARRLFVEELSRVLDAVDVLATPTLPVAAPPIGATTVEIAGRQMPISGPGGSALSQNTSPANQAGVPAITLPTGCTDTGLPVGLQLMGAAFQDWKLLAIAAFLEGVTRFDATPPALRTAEVLS